MSPSSSCRRLPGGCGGTAAKAATLRSSLAHELGSTASKLSADLLSTRARRPGLRGAASAQLQPRHGDTDSQLDRGLRTRRTPGLPVRARLLHGWTYQVSRCNLTQIISSSRREAFRQFEAWQDFCRGALDISTPGSRRRRRAAAPQPYAPGVSSLLPVPVTCYAPADEPVAAADPEYAEDSPVWYLQ